MDYKKYKAVKIINDNLANNMALVSCKGYKFKIRKDKIDAFTVDEVFKCGYFKHLELNKTDTVLDIGMNIGVFTVAASKLAKKVIAYEPDIVNFNLAKENIKLNNVTNVEIYNKAIAEENGELKLYLNSGVCTDCHSTLEIKGRKFITVKSQSLNDVIEKYKPTKLKVDCEGEELNFMTNANIENIKNLAMEVHFAYSYRDKHIKYYKLLDNVKKYFLNIKSPKVNDRFSRMLFAKNSKSEYKTFD
jgi:FkbM family methyltransferase